MKKYFFHNFIVGKYIIFNYMRESGGDEKR